MPRHHTVSFPRVWVEAGTLINDIKVERGYWQPSYQLDIQYTPEEEIARDEEEARDVIRRATQEQQEIAQQILKAKLDSGVITYPELLEMLKDRI